MYSQQCISHMNWYCVRKKQFDFNPDLMQQKPRSSALCSRTLLTGFGLLMDLLATQTLTGMQPPSTLQNSHSNFNREIPNKDSTRGTMLVVCRLWCSTYDRDVLSSNPGIYSYLFLTILSMPNTWTTTTSKSELSNCPTIEINDHCGTTWPSAPKLLSEAARNKVFCKTENNLANKDGNITLLQQ